jgi:hypothetical protein
MERINDVSVVTVYSADPIAKTMLLSNMVLEVLEKSWVVEYLDLDCQFSSFVSLRPALVTVFSGKENFHLTRTDSKHLIQTIVSLLSVIPTEQNRLIIIDSFNSLQDMLRESSKKNEPMKGNHEASVIITLLQGLMDHVRGQLIISDIAVTKPKGDSLDWEKDLSGGRILRTKSDLIISVSADTFSQPAKVKCIIQDSGANSGKSQRFEFIDAVTWN